MFQTVVFDLDGTLLDTLQDLAFSGNKALSAMGLPTHPVESYKQMVGNGIPKLVERMLPENAGQATRALALELFRTTYEKHMWDTTKPYPGILHMLEILKENGILTAVLSNKQHAFVGEICARYFPGLLSASVGHKPEVPPKPDPTSLSTLLATLGAAPATTLYCGDSNVDVFTAQNAGLPCCAVTWGFRSREELAAAGATYFATGAGELLDLILHAP